MDTIDGRYGIKRLIAEGAHSRLYEVEDTLVRQRVALKILRSADDPDADAIERFRREIQLARRVTHPNVCRIFDAGVAKGTPYFTMELLKGESLSHRLARLGRLPTEAALLVVKQICLALAAAHKAGVVHRDLKSSCVMLLPAPDPDSLLRVVITDFGVARAFGVETGSFVTAIGTVLGTPEYMAPEQVDGGEITPRTDIYALGVLLYEMITGKLPFSGGDAAATDEPRLKGPPPSPRLHVPDLDPVWELTVVKCMAIDPAERFPDATAVADALSLADDLPTIVGYDSLPTDIPELPPPDYPPEATEFCPDPPEVEDLPDLSEDELAWTSAPHLDVGDAEGDVEPEPSRVWVVHASAFVAVLIAGWLILRPTPAAWDGDLGTTSLPTLNVAATAPAPAPVFEPAAAPAPAPPPPRPARRKPAPTVVRAAAPDPPPPAPPKAPRRAVPPKAPPPPVVTPPPRYATLMKEARAAYAARNYVKAIYRAEYALRERPGEQEALAVAAMAGCQLKNAAIASKYLRQLRGERAALVKQICLTNRVSLR